MDPAAEKRKSVDPIAVVMDVLKHWLTIVMILLAVGIGTYILTDLCYEPQYQVRVTLAATNSDGAPVTYSDLSSNTELAAVFSELLNSPLMRKKVLAVMGTSSFDGTISAATVPYTNLLELTVTASDPRTAFLAARAILDHYREVTGQVVDSGYLEVIRDAQVPTQPINRADGLRNVKKMLLLAAMGTCVVFLWISAERDTVRSDKEARIDLFAFLEDFLLEARKLLLPGIVLVAVCGMLLGLRGYLTYRPIYRASASFTVSTVDPLHAGTGSHNRQNGIQLARTFSNILTSNELRTRIMEEMDMAEMPVLSVSLMPSTGILTLTAEDPDPQRACELLREAMTCGGQIAEHVVGCTALGILDESGVPTAPTNPLTMKQWVLKGGILGGGIWCVLVLLIAMTRNTIHNEADLSGLRKLVCLGRIPGERNRNEGFRDAIRALGLRVDRAMAEQDKKVLLLSGAMAGEGTTTICLNLAVAMAEQGRNVLLIDGDLRMPSIAQRLDLPAKDTLADYLRDECDIRQILYSTEWENLTVIPGGTGAAQQLAGEKGKQLIRWARDLFDFVILDTAPCSLLADAGYGAELAEAGLLVVRRNFASREQILDGAQRLEDAMLPLLGWVLHHAEEPFSAGESFRKKQ